MTIPTHNTGLATGIRMTDAEILRFYNGCLAAIQHGTGIFPIAHDHNTARRNIETVMDALGEQGFAATVGYAGTPVIRAFR